VFVSLNCKDNTLPLARNVDIALHILYHVFFMPFRPILSLFLALTLLSGCRNDGSRDIRDYYFPLKKLQDGLVYEYSADDSLTPAYWYFRSVLDNNQPYLTGAYYEQELEPIQITREAVVKNGILQKDLRLFTQSPSGKSSQIIANIEYANVFPFTVRDSLGVFLHKVQWTDDEGQNITITKNRRFAGDSTLTFQGKLYPVIFFTVLESVELEHPTQGYFEQILRGREAFAEGLGLVMFEKGPENEPPIRYTLVDRYPMIQLEQKALQRKSHPPN
jgi:hypothetical protein